MASSDREGSIDRLRDAVERRDLRACAEIVRTSAGRLREYLAEGVTSDPDSPLAVRWLRPKGNLTRAELMLLLLAAALPLLIMLARISALPGVLSPGMNGSLLQTVGHDLSMMLSLQDVPAGDRDRVLYMLLLPMSAMLIAFTRLTLGIRMIGFRAILISVGFQESGIVPSVILICVMVAVVLTIRPSLVRLQLPYLARVSVIMCTSVVVLITSLLVAPWINSSVLWDVAFFPVIVLGLLAEGIAKTLDRDSGLTAMWRAGMTVAIALVLAGIAQISIVREIAILFPELVITQIVAIILISEFLDFRLLQDWDAKLSSVAVPRLFGDASALRVAVVRNRRSSGVIGRLGPPSRKGTSRRDVRRIVTALREKGHLVKLLEGDISLFSKLRDFIPEHPSSGRPGGIVFNLAHGLQGDAPAAHVPAMLEMSGVAYTGPTPTGQIQALDRLTADVLLAQAGVATAGPRPTSAIDGATGDPGFPLVVKPRHAARYKLRIARNQKQLDEALRLVARRDRQAAVVESLVEGIEIRVALVGNDAVECLPLVQVDAPDSENPMVCPAPLEAELALQVRETAIAAFQALSCRDYALLNVVVPSNGPPCVVDIDTVGVFAEAGAFELAAEVAGYGFADLIDRVLAVARDRYRIAEGPPALEIVPNTRDDDRPKGRTTVAG